jgi:hypothetical protein
MARPVCKGCFYYCGSTNTCDYILIEGIPRGCVPTDEHCDCRSDAPKERKLVDLVKINQYLDEHSKRLQEKERSLRRDLYYLR